MKRTRIPFGYDIIEGKAHINEQETGQLKKYFRLYLEGLSMSAAAQEARLPCSSTTLPHFFKRKEYIGTDYYPPIITAEYQKQLVDEWMKRKSENPRQSKPCPKKGVRIYTDFRLTPPVGDAADDPVTCAAVLYQRIRAKHNQTPNRG